MPTEISTTIRRQAYTIADQPQLQGTRNTASPPDVEKMPVTEIRVIRRRAGSHAFRHSQVFEVPEGKLQVHANLDHAGARRVLAYLTCDCTYEMGLFGGQTRVREVTCYIEEKTAADGSVWLLIRARLPRHVNLDRHRLMGRPALSVQDALWGIELSSTGMELMPSSDARLRRQYIDLGLPPPSTVPKRIAAKPGRELPPERPVASELPSALPDTAEPSETIQPDEPEPAAKPPRKRIRSRDLPDNFILTIPTPITDELLLTVKVRKQNGGFDTATAELEIRYLGEPLDVAIRRRPGKNDVRAAFLLPVGPSWPEISFRLRGIDEPGDGFYLSKDLCQHILEQVMAAESREAERIRHLEQATLEMAAALFEAVDGVLDELEEMLLDTDLNDELRHFKDDVLALERELRTKETTVYAAAKNYQSKRDQLPLQFAALPEKIAEIQAQMIRADALLESSRATLKAAQMRQAELVSAFSLETNPERLSEILAQHEQIEADIERQTRELAARQATHLSEQAQLSQRLAEYQNEPLRAERDQLILALDALAAARTRFELTSDSVRRRLEALRQGITEARRLTRLQERTARESASQMQARSNELARQREARNFAPGSTRYTLNPQLRDGRDASRMFWQGERGTLAVAFHVTRDTYMDISMVHFDSRGERNDLGSFQAIIDSSARGGFYLVSLQHSVKFNPRCFILWTTGEDGEHYFQDVNYADLPETVRLQATMNVFSPKSVGSDGELRFAVNGSEIRVRLHQDENGKTVAGSASWPRARSHGSSLKTLVHPGENPVLYLATARDLSRGEPQQGRYFVLRQYAGEWRLGEHVWEGLPEFVRLALETGTDLSASAQRRRITDLENGTQVTYATSTGEVAIHETFEPIDKAPTLSSRGFYGWDDPRLRVVTFFEGARSFPAHILGSGENWADQGGFLVVFSIDPDEGRVYVEFNPSGGADNRLMAVPREKLPLIYRQLMPAAVWYLTRDDVSSETLVFKRGRSGTERIVMISPDFQNASLKFSQLGIAARLSVMGQSERDLIPFSYETSACEVLYLASPDGTTLWRLEWLDGQDVLMEFGADHRLSDEVKRAWRQTVLPGLSSTLVRQPTLAAPPPLSDFMAGRRTILETSLRLQRPAPASSPSLDAASPALADSDLNDGALAAGPAPDLTTGHGMASEPIDSSLTGMGIDTAMTAPGAAGLFPKLR